MSDDGVNVIGYVHERSGLGEIARLLIASLEHAGIPHVVIPVGSRPVRQRLRPPAPVHDTNLVCVNPGELPALVEVTGRKMLLERRTIGFWWWEVDHLPPEMAMASHLVDEIWVGSDHVRRAIESSVSKPVHVFPVPIVPPRAQPVSRPEFGLPDARFAFVFSFNFWSIFERKNPLGLIEAFSRSFRVDEGPILVIKSVAGRSYPDQMRALRAAAAPRRDIFLVEQALPPDRYHGLIAACDAYASLHRAEGLGLTIAEAMALGKPAVATRYSGNLEFMNDANSYLVPSSVVRIPEGLRHPYGQGASWAEPDLDVAAELLRRVVERPDEARVKVEASRRDFPAAHGLAQAGDFVRARLAEPPLFREVPTSPVDRAAYELMWGPDLETARPWARQMRLALRPFLRPYTDHQRRVNALVLDALRGSRERDASGPDQNRG